MPNIFRISAELGETKHINILRLAMFGIPSSDMNYT